VSVTAGVDIGGTKVLAAVVDEQGTIRHRVSAATDPERGTQSLVHALEDLFAGTDEKPAAIGVGVAAFVEYPSGRVVFAPNLRYEMPDISGEVSKRFGLPLTVENDANAAAWGENQFGAGKGVADMLMVTVGTGIGGGIVARGALYRGSRGLAAEFGHMTIVEGGPICACGQRGCLEAMASGTAIARMAREGIGGASDSILMELTGGDPKRITGALVSEAAHAFDDYSTSILERAGRSLGVGLTVLTNAFDPALIVIGGGGAEAGDFLLAPATLELRNRLAGRREPPPVSLGMLGNDAGVIGVSSLARLVV
jgi:glucokinase